MADYTKPDHWSIKAQKEGYPARSVYKLKEIDEKFGLLKSNRPDFKALDLGAAPGSWSLYILRKLPKASLLSNDLSPLSRQYDNGLFDRQGFSFIQGDFTLAPVRDAIISGAPYNLIVSDAAPATSGNRSLDTLRSLGLAETVLSYAVGQAAGTDAGGDASDYGSDTSDAGREPAPPVLARGGNFLIKIFQGGETGALLKKMRGPFENAKAYKPQVCRAESYETYFLGLGFKG